MSSHRIEIGNSTIAELSGVARQSDNLPINNASVLYTLYEKDRVTEVAGQAWPLTLVNVADGVYQGTLEPTVDVVCGKKYWSVVTAVAGGFTLLEQCPTTAVVRC